MKKKKTEETKQVRPSRVLAIVPIKQYILFEIFFRTGIIQQAARLTVCESICSFCSRMKRGRLYACARREGYNVLAMGQHLDDLAER